MFLPISFIILDTLNGFVPTIMAFSGFYNARKGNVKKTITNVYQHKLDYDN
jgi:hypothetical protein